MDLDICAVEHEWESTREALNDIRVRMKEVVDRRVTLLREVAATVAAYDRWRSAGKEEESTALQDMDKTIGALRQLLPKATRRSCPGE
jgi:hypothetical protein